LKPETQRDFAIFKDASHFDGERLVTVVALVKTNAGGFAFELPYMFNTSTMRANRAIRPKPGFDKLKSGFFTKELRG